MAINLPTTMADMIYLTKGQPTIWKDEDHFKVLDIVDGSTLSADFAWVLEEKVKVKKFCLLIFKETKGVFIVADFSNGNKFSFAVKNSKAIELIESSFLNEHLYAPVEIMNEDGCIF